MYCDYYGFREKPFNITPDPGFIFLSEHHREAFAHLLYGIDSHIGFISLTGEVGTGKTTVLRTLLSQLSADKYRTALIFNPCLSSLGLMQHIHREYGLPASATDTADLLHDLNQFLLSENSAGRTVVLVVDEAQNLEPAVLEQIRLISNLETERDKLIQIVLAGQPELRDLLNRRELRQLGQRIGVGYHLYPMNLADTRAYITHRIEIAGRKDDGLFTPGATSKIFNFSQGIPRIINLVCDRALLLGYSKEKVPISPAMATLAIADISRSEKRNSRSRLLLLSTLLLLSLVLVAGGTILAVQHWSAPRVAVAGADFHAAVQHMAKLSESASAVAAFNELAASLKVPPVSRTAQNITPERLAHERGLEQFRFSGPMGRLLRFQSPAILEFALPGAAGRRYLALTRIEGERIYLAPQLSGIESVKISELEKDYSGNAYFLYKNYLEIPVNLKHGAKGEQVRRLQGLLRGAGAYGGMLNGRFDLDTLSAVKEFQRTRGIDETGIVGRQTLMMLYRNLQSDLSTPRTEKRR